jgi:hypothetical protein
MFQKAPWHAAEQHPDEWHQTDQLEQFTGKGLMSRINAVYYRIVFGNTLQIMLLWDQIFKYLQFCSLPLPETVDNWRYSILPTVILIMAFCLVSFWWYDSNEFLISVICSKSFCLIALYKVSFCWVSFCRVWFNWVPF